MTIASFPILDRYQPHHSQQYSGYTRQAKPLWPHIFMGLFGLGWAMTQEIGVRLYWAEIIAFTLLIFTKPILVLRQYQTSIYFITALILWVLAIFISDTLNDTPIFDMLRAMSTPILGGVSFIFALACISRNPYSFCTFLLSIAIFKFILGDPAYGDKFADQTVGWSSVQENTNYFKVRFAPALTPFVALLAAWLSKRYLSMSILTLLGFSIFYFYLDVRAGAVILLLAAFALTAKGFKYKPTVSNSLVVLLVGLPLMYGAYVAYINYTLSGDDFSHNAIQVLRMKNPYNPIELITQGRSDWLIAWDAIKQKPFFGFGSWAEDKNNYFTYLMLDRTGVGRESAQLTKQYYIPVHSLTLSTVVWGGILALIPVVCILFKILQLFIRSFKTDFFFLPAVYVLSFELFWHALFSPPQSMRLFFHVTIAILIYIDVSQKSLYTSRQIYDSSKTPNTGTLAF